VVVRTIAATRTSGGLRVEAALDTGEDPTGVAISRERSSSSQEVSPMTLWNELGGPGAPAPGRDQRARRHLADDRPDDANWCDPAGRQGRRLSVTRSACRL
jgi:hypothetical protein